MTLLFSTLIQFVDKKYIAINEEIYVRVNFIKIIRTKIPEIDDMIQELVESPMVSETQTNFLELEKVNLLAQIDFEENRINQLKEEKELLKPEVENVFLGRLDSL